MAVRLLAYEVADLCLGKPPLRSLSSAATVADALAAVKVSDENFVSVWSCDHSEKRNLDCVCVGKVCMVDIVCYLCREENLSSPGSALRSPISVLLSKVEGLVRHVEPSSSLLEAIDLILQGAQNLLLPIKCSTTTTNTNTKRKQLQKSITPTIHNGQEFCWLTQEDVIRFLLSSIGLFSPISTLSVNTLGIISNEFLAVEYHSPALSALAAISSSIIHQTAVAVVDDEGTLIGEISPATLACRRETAAAAVLTLSAGDLMAYIDCSGPSEEIASLVGARLKERNLEEFMVMIGPYGADATDSSSSSDEDSPTSTITYRRTASNRGRMVRSAEAVVCQRRSSLVAVMIQAIAHRVNYVWVVEEDGGVAGIVTFGGMLEVFREILESMK